MCGVVCVGEMGMCLHFHCLWKGLVRRSLEMRGSRILDAWRRRGCRRSGARPRERRCLRRHWRRKWIVLGGFGRRGCLGCCILDRGEVGRDLWGPWSVDFLCVYFDVGG